MNESLNPDWVNRMIEQDRHKSANVEAETLQQVAASKTILADSPMFWKQLLKELRFTVDSPGLKDGRVQASISEIGSPQSAGEVYRISVNSTSAIAKIAQTDLHYSPGCAAVRCLPLPGQPFDLRWCVDAEGKVALRGEDGRPMNAEQAAQAIVQPLVDRVRP